MLVFTITNAVRVSLLQVGVVVIGVLGAATGFKICQTNGTPVPTPTVWWMDYGFLLLALPVLWLFAALRLHRSPAAADTTKALAFVFGIALLVLMLGFAGYAGLRPWLVLFDAPSVPAETME